MGVRGDAVVFAIEFKELPEVSVDFVKSFINAVSNWSICASTFPKFHGDRRPHAKGVVRSPERVVASPSTSLGA